MIFRNKKKLQMHSLSSSRVNCLKLRTTSLNYKNPLIQMMNLKTKSKKIIFFKNS